MKTVFENVPVIKGTTDRQTVYAFGLRETYAKMHEQELRPIYESVKHLMFGPQALAPDKLNEIYQKYKDDKKYIVRFAMFFDEDASKLIRDMLVLDRDIKVKSKLLGYNSYKEFYNAYTEELGHCEDLTAVYDKIDRNKLKNNKNKKNAEEVCYLINNMTKQTNAMKLGKYNDEEIEWGYPEDTAKCTPVMVRINSVKKYGYKFNDRSDEYIEGVQFEEEGFGYLNVTVATNSCEGDMGHGHNTAIILRGHSGFIMKTDSWEDDEETVNMITVHGGDEKEQLSRAFRRIADILDQFEYTE